MIRNLFRRLFRTRIYCVPLMFIGCDVAANVQPVNEILEAARRHVASQPPARSGKRVIEVGRIDSRVQLRRCSQSLRTRAGPGHARGGRQTIIVSCPAQDGWQLYVPVAERYLAPFVVARRGLARGEVITRADVAIQEMRVARGDHGLFDDVETVIGMAVRRPVSAGSPLKSQQVEPVAVVARGDRVTIHAVASGIQVRMQGESLADAAMGERVRVRNLSSRRIVEGIAVGAGRVRVGS